MNEVFRRARLFIYRNARPVDLALWRFHFEGGSREDVLTALSAYQNPDGGFGHGLEADALNPDSSPIQTWCATTILRQIDLFDADHAVVSGILRYLDSGADFDGHCWARVIPTNNDHPHAPWWSFSPCDSVAKREYNPTAALAGFLLRAAPKPSPLRARALQIAREACDFFLSGEAEPEMHLLSCYLELTGDLDIAEPEFDRLREMKDKLAQGVRACILADADRWGDGYCAMPSSFISKKGDPLCACFPEIVQREREFIMKTQEPSGAWKVTWQWGAYPDDFAVSANHWRSQIILKNLLFLRNTDALEA